MPPKLCNSAHTHWRTDTRTHTHTHIHKHRSRLKSSEAGEDMHVMVVCLCTVGVVCTYKCVCVFVRLVWPLLLIGVWLRQAQKVPQLSWAFYIQDEHYLIKKMGYFCAINNNKDGSLVDFGGAQPSPGIAEPPWGLRFWFRPPHPQTCPHDARLPHWACPPFVAAERRGGSGWQGGGWWSPRLCLIIRPIYTWHQTVQQTGYRTAATKTVLTEDASRLRFII